VRAIAFEVQVAAPVPQAEQAPLEMKYPVTQVDGTRLVLQVNAFAGHAKA